MIDHSIERSAKELEECVAIIQIHQRMLCLFLIRIASLV